MLQTVLFHDGSFGRFPVYVHNGAALVGQPTAYVYRDNKLVWVRPGQSVDWIEA